MGKASRLKKRRRPSIPGIRDSPYADAFTTAEWQEVEARKDRLMRYFRDAVKVTDGTIIGIDDATLQLLVLHAVLAGVTQDDELALIRPKVLPDEEGRLADSHEWIVKRFDTEEARQADAEEEARRRHAAVEVVKAQMTPEAQDAYRRMFEPAARQAFELGGQQHADYLERATDETDEAREMREQATRLRERGEL
ncbi:MAG: hypothetical protein K2Y33_02035 [Mycolicibacterium frederiksbergense]|nr:hypothetical protein [Mycolicibacterium frederiksbergense]